VCIAIKVDMNTTSTTATPVKPLEMSDKYLAMTVSDAIVLGQTLGNHSTENPGEQGQAGADCGLPGQHLDFISFKSPSRGGKEGSWSIRPR
jgi:hypothetical protein